MVQDRLVGGGHGMIMQGGKNDPMRLPPHHVQSAQMLAHQHQHQQQRRTVGGAMVNQGQRPASHAVKGSIQESRTGLTKLPPSMQKPSGSGAVYMTSQERRNQEQHRPEPDSDSVSNVSMESGLNSPTGDGRANANENTLVKGIDGDIQQMRGKESSVGGGVEAPYDPNLTCPSCGFRFRIREIQKFKDMRLLVQALNKVLLLWLLILAPTVVNHRAINVVIILIVKLVCSV